jgi:hypothetical protein
MLSLFLKVRYHYITRKERQRFKASVLKSLKQVQSESTRQKLISVGQLAVKMRKGEECR